MTSRRVTRRRDGRVESVDDHVVVEEPMEIRLGDTAIAVIMRTPGHDDALIRGFALTEGIVLDPAELVGVEDLGEGRRRIVLRPDVHVDPERFRRNLYATSSCGVCGKASIDAVRVAARTAPSGPIATSATITALPVSLRATQAGFDLTGALHAAAAFTSEGTLVASAEDVGRHNAVDKVIGMIAGAGWPVETPMLFVSGRISFEIVQKAAVAGFSIVAGVSGVSSLAIELGKELGLTVIGFVRGNGFNVYAGSQRVDQTSVGCPTKD